MKFLSELLRSPPAKTHSKSLLAADFLRQLGLYACEKHQKATQEQAINHANQIIRRYLTLIDRDSHRYARLS